MTDPREHLRDGDALLVVDVQNDFCPGGRLAIEDGDAVIPPLNAWMAAAVETGVPVYASRDFHPANHVSFEPQGGPWPVHCVQDTEGAAFHPELALPRDVVLVTKGVRFDHDQNSAFEDTGLAEQLARDGVQRLWVGGLAQDVCVKATVVDGCRAGFAVHLIAGATRPVTGDGGEQALAEMRQAGAVIA